jgi:hypothetical protein
VITWPAIVQGLQLFCLVTWAVPLLNKAGCVLKALSLNATREEARWAGIWFFALAQCGFSVRWLIFHHGIAGMPLAELQLWALLYLSSALSCIFMLWTQGMGAAPRKNRCAILLHFATLAVSIGVAALL